MTVLEIGLIKNSMLILHESYYPLKNIKKHLTPERRSQLLNQINSLSQIVLEDEIQAITNAHLQIFWKPFPHKKENSLAIYAITDQLSDKNIVSQLLISLISKFQKSFPEQSNSFLVETSKYQKFKATIHDVLLDERYSPSDRMRNYLF